jgi:hypothetical protein
MLGVILSVLRASLNDRRAKKLCSSSLFPSPTSGACRRFWRTRWTPPPFPSFYSFAISPTATPRRARVIAHSQVCALDAELTDAMTPIVDAVAALEADDPEFTLEHVLSELALGGIGLAPTAGRGALPARARR